jgi:hypothetical protein
MIPAKPANTKVEIPTRVLYLARVRDREDAPDSDFAAENEKLRIALLELFSPFGPVDEIIFPPGKRFAFILFDTIDSAVRARDELHDKNLEQIAPPELPNKRLFIRFAAEQLRVQSSSKKKGNPDDAIDINLPPPSDFTNCDSSCTDIVCCLILFQLLFQAPKQRSVIIIIKIVAAGLFCCCIIVFFF